MTYDGVRKPAFADVQRSYTTTPQLIVAYRRGDAAAHRSGLGRRPGPHAAAGRVGELVVTGPQAAVRLHGEGQRDASGGGGLGLVGDAVVAAASRIVLVIGGPVRRAVGTKEHQEERAAENEGHEVENAEDHEQLRVGGHCVNEYPPRPRANRACGAMFATMLGRSPRRFSLPATTT